MCGCVLCLSFGEQNTEQKLVLLIDYILTVLITLKKHNYGTGSCGGSGRMTCQYERYYVISVSATLYGIKVRCLNAHKKR